MSAVRTATRPAGSRVRVDVPLALVGPTASGKTEASILLARRLGAEVLLIDSMTVYRGMDVGTAKPAQEERAGVPHHLVDVADPAERFSVARFQALAREALAGIRDRDRPALLVGGAGLYFRAVVDDLEFPGTDPALRRGLEAEADVLGASALHRRLAGLVEEVRSLLDSGIGSFVTASQAIGYLEVAEHLQGRLSLDEAKDRTVRRTRALARRQMAWFRRDPRIRWIEAGAPRGAGVGGHNGGDHPALGF